PGDTGLRPEPRWLAGGPRHWRAHRHALGPRLGTGVALHRDPGAPAFPREGGADCLRRSASRPLNGRLREFRDPVDPPERDLEGVGSGIVLASPLLPQARYRFPVNRLRDVPLTRVRTALKLLQEGVGGHRLVERTHRNHHIRFHEAGKIAFVDTRMMIFVPGFAS